MTLFYYYGNRAHLGRVAFDFTTDLTTPIFQKYLITQKICTRECYDHFDPPAEYDTHLMLVETLEDAIKQFMQIYEKSSIIYIDGLNIGEMTWYASQTGHCKEIYKE